MRGGLLPSASWRMLHVYPGAVHGFNAVPTETARQYKLALQTALKNAFAFAKR